MIFFSIGWFFRFQPLNFQGVYHTFWAPNKIMGKTRSFVPGAASSWPPSVRSFPSQWRGQNRCFWVNFFGTWGVCRLVRVGILKNWRKNILQSLKLWINESNLQNNWKILEMWKCHPLKTQNGFMECRFYVMCVFFAHVYSWRFHHTDWLIRILITAYSTLYITGWYNPLYTTNNQGLVTPHMNLTKSSWGM